MFVKIRSCRAKQQKASAQRRKVSLDVHSNDSSDVSTSNPALKGLQDGLTQYFTPSNRRKSRNSFTLHDEVPKSSPPVIIINFDYNQLNLN